MLLNTSTELPTAFATYICPVVLSKKIRCGALSVVLIPVTTRTGARFPETVLEFAKR